MEKPFDARMSKAMIETTQFLVEHNHACIGYTQSDEISLIFIASDDAAQVIFNGRVQKLVGVLASMAAAAFTRAILNTPGFEHYSERLPHFDCRVYQLPDREKAAEALLWRENDARKNAVSMAAQKYFSHKSLQGKSSREMRQMLAEKGIDFDAYPDYFKRGTYLRRVTESRTLTEAERMAIRPDHRPDPEMTFLRSSVKAIAMPYLGHVQNRAEVIFEGAEPVTMDEAA
jgi:tRNA(His) 5'-end guanylyltransferase